MKYIRILGAVHQDFRHLSLLGAAAVPPLTLLSLAHGGPLAACVPHDCLLRGWLQGHYVQSRVSLKVNQQLHKHKDNLAARADFSLLYTLIS